MSEDRLIRSNLFQKSGKYLLAEYFKFQIPQKNEKLIEFELNNYNDISHFLDKWNQHLKELSKI